jgi:hypothetical protein
MKTEFIPYEQALALKELGFDEPCLASYETAFGKGIDFELGYIIDGPKNYVLAPLYQQAFRWFREKYDLVHRINRDGGYWICATLDLYDEADQGAIEKFIDCYPNTYEEAELACLNKLIEIVKNK